MFKPIRPVVILPLLLLCTGCAGPGTQTDLGQAARAKAALLELMRSDPSIFTGADPTRFETVELKEDHADPHKFYWGAFTIDVEKRTYDAHVEVIQSVWFYNGTFTVDRGGRWKAELPQTMHGQEPPPQK